VPASLACPPEGDKPHRHKPLLGTIRISLPHNLASDGLMTPNIFEKLLDRFRQSVYIELGQRDAVLSGATRGGGASIMIADHLGLLMEASSNLDNFEPEDDGKSQSGNMVIVSVGLAGFTF
jgi:hypothetical protein